MATVAQRDLVALALAPSQTEREKAARTHNAIREHLETDPALSKYKVDTYLQGSYKNSTNVRGDSDVDMGSLTNEVFHYQTDWLPTEPRRGYGYVTKSLKESIEESLQSLPAGSFSFWQYRADVLSSLQRKYGDSVEDGNKAIKVRGNSYRLDADVLPCMSFRQYFQRGSEASYHNGITFFKKPHEQVVNFPHQHFTNLSDKDQRSDGKVKGCARILKRLRNEFEENRTWDRKRSPSYYLEGLLWNVPDGHFQGNYDSVLQNVLAFLWEDLTEKKKQGDLTSYSQANNIFVLFHPNFWNVDDALAFILKVWQAIYER
jgi:hypothetical protein